MEDQEIYIPPRVSYLQARDPSILSWNRHGMDVVRHNLLRDFDSEGTIPSTSSEKQDENIEVFLRIKDGVEYADIYSVKDDSLMCKIPEGSHIGRHNRDNVHAKKYQFTKVFGPETDQRSIFNQIVKDKILSFINGYNNSLLAYGSSGSGKTFTMVGTADQPGIIVRALEYLFRSIPKLKDKPDVKPLVNGKVIALEAYGKENSIRNLENILNCQVITDRSIHARNYREMQGRLSNEPVAIVQHCPPILSVWVSFAEIYNEVIYDLLQPSPARGQQRPKLKLGGVQDHTYIKGLEYIYIKSGLDAYQVLQYGLTNLNYATTAINMHSSRSHCIFTIRLVQGLDFENATVSSFNFCDLAGSERLKKTMNVGDRLKESNNINTSLLVLGRCISDIREGQHKKGTIMPPFRESKLTQLFQRALMGKENIVLIVNINPSPEMLEETQHTLNFAGIAKDIIQEKPAPPVLKPNRFSSIFQSHLSRIQEDDDDRERELRNDLADKMLEISELRLEVSELREKLEECNQNANEQIDAERQHLINIYTELVDSKNGKIKELQKENESLKRKKTMAPIVVITSDSDEESDIVTTLENQKHQLKMDLYKALQENGRMVGELKEKSKREKSLIEELKEAKLTIEDAKNDFQLVVDENEELRQQMLELKNDLFQSEETCIQRELEINALRQIRSDLSETIEKLEDANRLLSTSRRYVQSPQKSKSMELLRDEED